MRGAGPRGMGMELCILTYCTNFVTASFTFIVNFAYIDLVLNSWSCTVTLCSSDIPAPLIMCCACTVYVCLLPLCPLACGDTK